ncbi:MAG TPA: hypothetical protein VFA55_05015, partial [Candidatus Kapabacteria bacterium]|nr:hypothetical protein [Candidatus Kapabacteria bacterium]
MSPALRYRISLIGNLDWLVTFFLFAGYLTWPIYIFQIVQIGTFPVILSMVCLAIAMVFWGIRFIVGKHSVEWHTSSLWIVAICVAVILSETTLILQGAPSSHSVLSIIHLFFYAASVLVWATEQHAATTFIKVLRIQILFGVAICLFGVYQIFARLYNLPFAWIEMSNVVYSQGDQISLRFANFYRATSIFSE